MKVEQKKVLITGATGGIGMAVAQALASKGCQLLLTGRDHSKLDKLATSLSGSGHSTLVTDLNESEGLKLLHAAAEAFEIDIMINSMGINQLSLLSESSENDIENIMTTNLTTPILVCKTMLPLLIEKSDTAIVNIGSILGSIGYAGSSVYCASKFGLRGFTESLRRELSDKSLRIIYFAPRATDTELNSDAMQQMNKALGNTTDTPEWVAGELVKVLEKKKSCHRYLGWPESLFVRINALLPHWVDQSLAKQLATIKRYAKASR